MLKLCTNFHWWFPFGSSEYRRLNEANVYVIFRFIFIKSHWLKTVWKHWGEKNLALWLLDQATPLCVKNNTLISFENKVISWNSVCGYFENWDQEIICLKINLCTLNARIANFSSLYDFNEWNWPALLIQRTICEYWPLLSIQTICEYKSVRRN